MPEAKAVVLQVAEAGFGSLSSRRNRIQPVKKTEGGEEIDIVTIVGFAVLICCTG